MARTDSSLLFDVYEGITNPMDEMARDSDMSVCRSPATDVA